MTAIPLGLSKVIHVNPSSPNTINSNSCWNGGVTKPCATFSLGIEGLQIVANNEPSELVVSSGFYNFNNKELGNFFAISSLAIIGIVSDEGSMPVVTCSNGSGLSFIESGNITISGILFHHCNKLHNSTTPTNSSTNSLIEIYAAIYFLLCENIQLQNVSIENTQGTAVIMYNVRGKVNIIENCVIDSSASIGGGILIEYSFCDSTEYEFDCGNDAFTTDAKIVVKNSNFISNIAGMSNEDLSTLISSEINFKNTTYGKGGGLSIIFRGNSKSNVITIVNCTFLNNTAMFGGGGVFVEFQDYAFNNSVNMLSSNLFNNSAFYYNEGIVGGGGVQISFKMLDNSNVLNNTVFISETHFEGNHAYYGGGLSYYAILSKEIPKHDNNVRLSNCHFHHNQAVFGSALDLTTRTFLPRNNELAVHFENCVFTKNMPFVGGRLVGKGALFVDTTNAMFQGSQLFILNEGSALAATGGSGVVFGAFSNSSFVNNSGRHGAGLSLLGDSFIVVGDHTNLNFYNNSADYKGGAIYSGSTSGHDIILNNCFVRFENSITIPPEHWTTTFQFSANSANGETNSIYSSSVLNCAWNNDYRIETGLPNVFCWNAYNINWIYDGLSDQESCINHISTAPSSFRSNNVTKYNAIPGQTLISLNLNVSDDFNRLVNMSTFFTANHLTGGDARPKDNNIPFVVNGNVGLITARENTTVNLRLETIGPVVIQSYANIEFQKCPPGFKFDSLSKSCLCAGSFSGRITCNERKYIATVSRSTWIGRIEKNSTDHIIVAGLSPYTVQYFNDSIMLPNDINEIDNILCDHNRKGVLCGECKEGYSVSVNTNNRGCVKCNKNDVMLNWLFYILTEFVPVTIFFFIIFIFSSVIAIGPLNSFIFFAQIIYTVVKIDAEGMIPLRQNIPNYKILEIFFIAPYEFWNLNFLNFVLPRFCLGTTITTLDIYAIEYLTASLPLFLLLGFIFILFFYNRGNRIFIVLFRPIHRIFARLRTIAGLHQSITGGIAVFILVSYTKFALVSFRFLAYFPLYNPAGDVEEIVFYYDGSVLFPEEGMQYIIVAIFFLCTFVLIPPILLLYPSLLTFLERASRNRLKLGRFYPGIKMQAFFDEFHGCYRNGSEQGIDCRWFSSFYFCLRISLFTTYTQSNYWHVQYMIQLLMFLVVAMMFAFIRPYRNDWINNLDTVMFLNLAAITAISQYELQQARQGLEFDSLAFSLQIILVAAPLLYLVGYICLKMMKTLCKKHKPNWSFNDNSLRKKDASNHDHDVNSEINAREFESSFINYYSET